MAPELIGKTFNRYQITSLLAEGEAGFVYSGVESKFQREVVVQILPEVLARFPGFEERFLLATRTAARLTHPGLVKVLDFGKYENYLYMVTESIRGDTLAQRLEEAEKKREFIPTQEVIYITRQIALALDYANQQGVVHIDIHPSKVILRPAVQAKPPFQPVVTDLGLAWLATGMNLAQASTSFGISAYLSPEQARGAPLDIRSDVYALGVLLYELATVTFPFSVKTIAELAEYHRKEQPAPPRSIRPGLSESLEQVILKAMHKDPHQRFADMGSFAQALEKVAQSPAREQPSRPVVAPPPGASPLPPGGSKAPSAKPQTDYVLVEAPDRPAYTISITKEEMSIGRGKTVDIPLNSPGVSREHAKLVFDSRDYYLIDLDSTNGTFLDEGKLLPGVRDLWHPNKTARIGSFTLQLVRVGEKTPEPRRDRPVTQIFRRDGSLAESKHIYVSSGEGRIGVLLEDDDLEVAPGESVGMGIVLRNQGETVDHFRVNIEGVPASWITIQPQAVYLMPENQGTVQATYKPPKASTTKAGIYDLTIRVSSTEDPNQKVEIIATLTVQPFVDYTSELHPLKIDANQKARLLIRNHGNSPQTFVLMLKDKADKLKFSPPQAEVEIPEGKTGAIDFSAHTRMPHIINKPVSHVYTAELSVPAAGKKETYTGEVVSHGFIPVWLLPLLALLTLAGIFLVPKVIPLLNPPAPTPPPILVVTPTSAEGQGLTVIQEGPTPSPAPTQFCPGAPKPRVIVGNIVIVASLATDKLRVRTAPGTDKEIIVSLHPDEKYELVIIGGPKCNQEDSGNWMIWWQVRFNHDSETIDGWVAEGLLNDYYIEPITPSPTKEGTED